MNFKIKIITALMLSFSVFTTFSGQLESKDCPRGSLDKRFCDIDGDLLADAPTDPSKFINPYKLVFGTNPIHAFIFDEGAKKSFIAHMEKVTGKKVVFFPFQTNAALLVALDAGMLHVAGLNTGSVPTAVNCNGFRLIAMRAKKDNRYGYQMEIITYPQSGIEKMSDLKGEKVLFVSPSSNSGFKAPTALLKQRFNLEKNLDYEVRFSGKHSDSIKRVAKKEFKVAAVANGIAASLEEKGVIKKDSIKTLYTSESYPTTGYGYVYNLEPSLAKKIEEAFRTFKWQDAVTGSLKAFNKYDDMKFIEADYANKWEIIRSIDKASGISYNCDELHYK